MTLIDKALAGFHKTQKLLERARDQSIKEAEYQRNIIINAELSEVVAKAEAEKAIAIMAKLSAIIGE